MKHSGLSPKIRWICRSIRSSRRATFTLRICSTRRKTLLRLLFCRNLIDLLSQAMLMSSLHRWCMVKRNSWWSIIWLSIHKLVDNFGCGSLIGSLKSSRNSKSQRRALCSKQFLLWIDTTPDANQTCQTVTSSWQPYLVSSSQRRT